MSDTNFLGTAVKQVEDTMPQAPPARLEPGRGSLARIHEPAICRLVAQPRLGVQHLEHPFGVGRPVGREAECA